MVTADKLPPWSNEAEQAILGCLLVDPKTAVPACVFELTDGPESFYDLRHAEIYRAIIATSEIGPVDVVTVQKTLKANGGLEQAGGIIYLSALPDTTHSPAHLPAYIEDVQEKLVLRKMIRVCTEIAGRAYESADVAGLLDEAEQSILSIRKTKKRDSLGIKELVKAAILKIEEIWNRKGAIEGMATGFVDLDKMTGGLRDGEMTVIAGYPGAGKTSFAMNVVENAMLILKKKVAVFSLEMSAESLVTRFICSHARVNLRNIASGFLSDRDFPKLTSAAGKTSSATIWFEDESDLSIYQLRASARRLHQEYGIELVVVDYLQLLTALGGARKLENRQQEVSDISRGIKGMARELKVPVIALSQLNDEGKLRESRAIGQDADNVWRLKPEHQDEDDEEAQAIECEAVDLEIIKARNGPRGKVHLTFLKNYTRFESAAKLSTEDYGGSNRSQHND